MNNKLHKTGNIFFLLFISITSLFLAGLGFWQLGRLKEKNEFIAKVKQSIESAPSSLERMDRDQLFYSKIKIKGHFINGSDIHLYGRTFDKKNGYYLVTPFITENKTVLVARGWFDYKDKTNIANITCSPDEEITGIVLKSEKGRMFVPSNDLANNVWFTLNTKEASSFFGLALEDFYVIRIYETHNSHNPYLKPINIDNLLKIRNDHLEYAITWFSLSVILGIMGIIYNRKSYSVIH
jgi:surfeit locus 1 family protein